MGLKEITYTLIDIGFWAFGLLLGTWKKFIKLKWYYKLLILLFLISLSDTIKSLFVYVVYLIYYGLRRTILKW